MKTLIVGGDFGQQKESSVIKKIANEIGCRAEEIIFTRGTTESLNLVAYSLGNKIKDTGVSELLKKREEARGSGDYRESDILRDKIQSLGFLLEDTKSDSVLKLKEW